MLRPGTPRPVGHSYSFTHTVTHTFTGVGGRQTNYSKCWGGGTSSNEMPRGKEKRGFHAHINRGRPGQAAHSVSGMKGLELMLTVLQPREKDPRVGVSVKTHTQPAQRGVPRGTTPLDKAEKLTRRMKVYKQDMSLDCW